MKKTAAPQLPVILAALNKNYGSRIFARGVKTKKSYPGMKDDLATLGEQLNITNISRLFTKGKNLEKFKKHEISANILAQGIDKKMRMHKIAFILHKIAQDMPSFTDQNRPAKVKEIYRALKRDHPEMSAEMKARIAARQGKAGKQKQGPPYKGPLTKESSISEMKKIAVNKKEKRGIPFSFRGKRYECSATGPAIAIMLSPGSKEGKFSKLMKAGLIHEVEQYCPPGTKDTKRYKSKSQKYVQ